MTETPAAPSALIVAHGQPSNPGPAAAEIAALAGRVGALLPGWRVASATLAGEAELRAAIAALQGERLFIYPLFMADGWFTRDHLPARLRAAGARQFTQLAPFGIDPAVQDLTVALARRAQGQGAQALLLAAHGSFRSPAPAAVARRVAARIAAGTGLARVEAAFIDQSPRIADVARSLPPGSVCLPFFAARGEHVIEDVPDALTMAGFAGRLLDPVGLHASVPGLIAAALRSQALSQ